MTFVYEISLLGCFVFANMWFIVRAHQIRNLTIGYKEGMTWS